jgi:hypothetical protein
VSESPPVAALDQGWREAHAANAAGEFARLEALLTRLLPLAERVHGVESPEVERALQELAYAHRRQGKYAEAIPVLRRLVGLQERLHGPSHSGLGLSLDLLAAAVSRAHPDRMSEVKKLETRAAHIRLRRRR